MNLRRSRAAQFAAGLAAFAVVGATVSTGAFAQESPAPEPAPEATTTDSAPVPEPLPTPKDNKYHLGQSLQIRVNADGTQNAKAVNFRWSVNQLTVQSPDEDGTIVSAPVPDRGALIRYLNHFGHPSVDNGIATLEGPVENGVALSRTVSVWPQDEDPKVSLTAKFWLDGVEQASAQDVVGKSGTLTAQYTVSNLSTANYDVTVPDLDGNPVTVSQPAQQLYVGIAKTLLPQSYAGLNTPGGMGGADGRGNNQIQWIIVPTMPLNENGVKTFGWSARVTNAVIPSMLLQVQPVYHAANASHAEDEEAAAESDTSSSGIYLDPALAQIQSGLATVAEGFDLLAQSKGDPTCRGEDGNAISNPDGSGGTTEDPLLCINWKINTAINKLLGVEIAPGVGLVQLGQALQSLSTDQLALITYLEAIQGPVGDYEANPGGITPLIDTCPAMTVPTLTAQCAGYNRTLKSLPATDPQTDDISAAKALSDAIPGDIAILKQSNSKVAPLGNILAGLAPRPAGVTLADIVAQAKAELAANGGSTVQAGLSQVSAGVAQAKGIIAAYLSDAAAEIQAAAAAGKTELNTVIVNLRAEIAGLKAAMATSPFPYGGEAANTPPGTVLAGAYEFRIDAADTNHPYTLPRILVGLIALLAAGFAGRALAGRKENTATVADIE